jgi:simple sugar transport system ATP-binding protein
VLNAGSVAIARAMHFKSKFLILDEPTNYPSVKETNKIISFVKGLKPQGVTGISVGRNIYCVFERCDRIVGMARGEIVFNRLLRDTSPGEVHAFL